MAKKELRNKDDAEQGLREGRYGGWMLDLYGVEGGVAWDDMKEVIERYTCDWRMSGEGFGDIEVTIMDGSKGKLIELREEILLEFSDSYIVFDAEEEE
jgi:hypothetical protein